MDRTPTQPTGTPTSTPRGHSHSRSRIKPMYCETTPRPRTTPKYNVSMTLITHTMVRTSSATTAFVLLFGGGAYSHGPVPIASYSSMNQPYQFQNVNFSVGPIQNAQDESREDPVTTAGLWQPLQLSVRVFTEYIRSGCRRHLLDSSWPRRVVPNLVDPNRPRLEPRQQLLVGQLPNVAPAKPSQRRLAEQHRLYHHVRRRQQSACRKCGDAELRSRPSRTVWCFRSSGRCCACLTSTLLRFLTLRYSLRDSTQCSRLLPFHSATLAPRL